MKKIIEWFTKTIEDLKEFDNEMQGKGILKKVLMFVVIAVCHGLDQTTGMDTFRSMAIFAYAVNEVGSIIENIDACGWGKYIPQFLRNGLKKIKDKHKF